SRTVCDPCRSSWGARMPIVGPMPDQASDTIRLVYEAVNRRDLDSLVGALDPGIELRMPMDPLRVHPVFRGREGARAFYEVLFGVFDTYRVEPHRVEDLGRGVVVVVGRLVVRARGETIERPIRFSHFWEVREGRAA